MFNWLRELLGAAAPVVVNINIDKDAIALARSGDLVIVRAPEGMRGDRREQCMDSLSQWMRTNAPSLKFFIVEGGFEVTVLTIAKDGEAR